MPTSNVLYRYHFMHIAVQSSCYFSQFLFLLDILNWKNLNNLTIDSCFNSNYASFTLIKRKLFFGKFLEFDVFIDKINSAYIKLLQFHYQFIFEIGPRFKLKPFYRPIKLSVFFFFRYYFALSHHYIVTSLHCNIILCVISFL